jgi:uncharacterized membrane protein YidH (DUF202 family)
VRDESLAAERTALAWNRTGLAFVVAGAVTLRVFPPTDYLLGAAVGAAMVITGTVTAAFAWRQRDRPAAGRAVRRLAWATVVLAFATAAAALAP